VPEPALSIRPLAAAEALALAQQPNQLPEICFFTLGVLTREDLKSMQDDIVNIKRMVATSSEATRHASTISHQDLDSLESSLRICFVPVSEDVLDATAAASFRDTAEMLWEVNKHEAAHRDEYLDTLTKQVCILIAL
jgi:hypothetical protein